MYRDDAPQIILSMIVDYSNKGSGMSAGNCLLWIGLIVAVFSFCHSRPASRHLCHPGTYVHTTRNNKNICQPFPDATFMPDSLHTHKTCYSCTQIRDQNLELLKTECSRTRDAEILCIHGYYRRKARNTRELDRCQKCYECEHPTLPCQDYHDTVCCGHTKYVAVLNKSGDYECKVRPILCDPGQFLNPETEECTPCPPGMFMSEVQHDKTSCRPCKIVSGLGAHETILQACTSTQQANIGCEDGYFRNSSGNVWDEVRCLPCQKCEYQGRECDMYHDTVCCDHPDMTVVNTSSGYQCRQNPTTTSSSQIVVFVQTDIYNEEHKQKVCRENEYVQFSDGCTVCLPCERGTYIDKDNHTERVCKNFSQIQGSQAPRICQDLAEDVDKAETTWVWIFLISVIVILVVIVTGMSYYIVKLRRCQTKTFRRSENGKEINNFTQTAPLLNVHEKIDNFTQTAPLLNVHEKIDNFTQTAPLLNMHEKIDNFTQTAPLLNMHEKIDKFTQTVPLQNVQKQIEKLCSLLNLQ